MGSSGMQIREFLHRANMLEVEERLVAEKVMRARDLIDAINLIDPEHRYYKGGGKGEKGTAGNKKGKARKRGKKGKKGKR